MLIYTKKVTILLAIVVACTLGSLPSAASAAPIRVSPLKSVSLAPSVNCKGMNARQCEQASIAAAKPAPAVKPPAPAVKPPAAVGPVKPPAAVGPVKPPAVAPAVITPAFTPPVKPPAAPTRPTPAAPIVTVKLPTVTIPVKNPVTTNNDPSTKCGQTTIYKCVAGLPNSDDIGAITSNFRVVDNFAPNSSTVCTNTQQKASNPNCSAGAAAQNNMRNFDNAAATAATLAKSGTDQVTIVFTGYNTIANSSAATNNEKNSAMRAAQSASDFCGATSTIRYAGNGQVNQTAETANCVIVHANINNPGYAAALSECESRAKAAQKVCALTTPQPVTNNNYNTNGLRVTAATITTKPLTPVTTTTVPVCTEQCTTTTTTGPGGSNNNPGGSNNNLGGSNNNSGDPSNGSAGSAPDFSEYPEAIDPATGEPWEVSLLVDVKVPANYVANGKKTALTATVTLLCGGSPCGSNSLIDSKYETVTMSQKVETGLCARPTQLNCLYYAPENGKKQASPATYTMYFYTPSPSARQITTTLSVDAVISRIIPLEDGSDITVSVDNYRIVYRANGVGASSEISRPVLGSRG